MSTPPVTPVPGTSAVLPAPPTTQSGSTPTSQPTDIDQILSTLKVEVAEVKEIFQPKTVLEQAQNQYAQFYHWGVDDLGIPRFFVVPLALGAAIGVAALPGLVNVGMFLITQAAELVGDIVVKQMAQVRETGSPVLDKLVSDALLEFFGTEVGTISASTKPRSNQPLERAREIGPGLVGLLKKEMFFGQSGQLQPSVQGAETFLGFNVDFSIYAALMGILGEVESLGFLKNFRELGSDIARNLGLGRLARQAMMPLVKIGIQDPSTWALNKEFHPTMLAETQIVQLYASGDVSSADAHEMLDRLGYSDSLKNMLFGFYEKRFTVAETERLIRWKVWTFDQGVAYLKSSGFPQATAEAYITATQIARMDAEERQFLTSLRASFVKGFLTADQFNAHLANLHLAPGEVAVVQGIALAEASIPRKELTVAQTQKAFEENVIDLTELEAELTRDGYSPDDVDTLRVLTLLAAQKLDAAAKAKATKAAKTAAKAGAAPPLPTPPATK